MYKKLKIKNLELKNNIILAPMAGVTDKTFRDLCIEFGAGLVYSEMISAKGLLYDNANTKILLDSAQTARPVTMQLFGNDPYVLAEAAKKIEHYPFDILDINMGCPAPKIVKNGEGSALMKNPMLVGKIVESVVNATNKPVTVKIRKGIEHNINAVEIAKIAEASGASLVTVHGRFREQFYEGSVDLDIIATVKQALKIPVIASGDVIDIDTAIKTFEITKCDGLMIGRGSMGNPWIFKILTHYFETGQRLPLPTPSEKIYMAMRHCKMLITHKGEYIGIREMRKHAGWYLNGIQGAKALKLQINKATNYDELKNILEKAN